MSGNLNSRLRRLEAVTTSAHPLVRFVTYREGEDPGPLHAAAEAEAEAAGRSLVLFSTMYEAQPS